MRSLQPSIRIHVTVSQSLLDMIDERAIKDCTTRSGLIRQALIWYLYPVGQVGEVLDEEALLRFLRRRKAKAHFNRIRHELDSYH